MTTSITLSQAQDMLAAYIDAETKVLSGQSFRFGERLLTRADLAEIRRGRLEWQQTVDALQAQSQGGNRRVRFVDWNNS